MKDNQDSLEHLFRRKFNDEEAVAQREGWNTPSDEMWDRIQIGLSEKEKVTRRIMYWPLVGVAASFLLLSIFPLYQSKNKIDSLAAKLESNERTLEKMQKTLADISAIAHSKQQIALQEKEHLLSNLAILKEEIATDTKKTTVATPKIAPTNKKKTSESKLTNSYVIAPPLSGTMLDRGVANSSFSVDKVTEKSVVSSPIAITSIANRKSNMLYPPLTNLPTIQKELPVIISEKVIATSPIVAPTKNNKFYLAASIAPVWRTINNKNKATHLVNFEPKKVRQKSAFSAGIHAGMNLRKGWSVESGLRYTTTNDVAEDTRAITYQQVAEKLNNQGDFESNLTIQMSSSAGLTETVVVLSRNAISSIEEGTKIDLDLAMTNSQSYVDIPILARKQWRVGNLGLGITAGLLNRFLLEKNFDLPTVTLNDQRFSAQSIYISEKEGSTTTTAYLPYYLVGLDMEYEIYSGFYIFITPTLSRSIRSTIEADSADLYAQEKMLNMGVRYQL